MSEMDGPALLGWLQGKTREQLGAVEHEGRLLFKETLKRGARERGAERFRWTIQAGWKAVLEL